VSGKMQPSSCKIGTVPMLAYAVHGRDKMQVGQIVRMKFCVGDKWHTVRVNRIDDDGYFQADRF
jgi:hypothetical protein